MGPYIVKFTIEYCLFGLILGAGLVSAQNVMAPTAAAAALWHFAVRTTDEKQVYVFFPKEFKNSKGRSNTLPQKAYQVQRSDSNDFSQQTSVADIMDHGFAWAAIDKAWAGVQPPFYRVVAQDSKGEAFGTSTPSQPMDQAGNVFVMNGAPAVDGDNVCGDPTAVPCPDIRSAIRTAATTAATKASILVAPGIYGGDNNTGLTLEGKNFDLKSTNGREATVIDCRGLGADSSNKNQAFSFVSGDGKSTLSGFAIVSGTADAGGCVRVANTTLTIEKSLFQGCISNFSTGLSQGGAVYATGNADVRVFESDFIDNRAAEGAAMYVGGNSNLTVKGCTFQGGVCTTDTGRGGAIYATLSYVALADSTFSGGFAGYGGGAIMLERARAFAQNITAYNNTAGNFGGALLLSGSEMNISSSRIVGNRGNIFAGGVSIISSDYEAADTLHNGNWARVGGAGVKIMGGLLRMTRCQVNGNTAAYGGGLDISNQGEGADFTDIEVRDSEVRNNAVTDRGGGLFLDSFDTATFTNVSFINNTATKGGGGWCESATTAAFYNATFESNIAQLGGGLFMNEPCRMKMEGAAFRSNSAEEAGAGIATSSGVALNITRSEFKLNGNFPSETPMSGGGIMIGAQQLDINRTSAAEAPAQVRITDTNFAGNAASNRGGGVSLEAGVLIVDGTRVQNNRAIGKEGVGGGIAVIDPSCNAFDPQTECSSVSAHITNSAFASNFAVLAGGGLHYEIRSLNASIFMYNSTFLANSVAYDASNSKHGVGGGIFLGGSNFTLEDIQLDKNMAYYGGAMFLSANFDPATTRLSQIFAASNEAALGPIAFWQRSSSPTHELPTSAFAVAPPSKEPFATEVLSAAYSTKPPTTVQSAEELPQFSVVLLDYYGNIAKTERGNCAVQPSAVTLSDSSNDTATVRPQGADALVDGGRAVFSQLEVMGTIGERYTLLVNCTSSNFGGGSRYLNLAGQPLEPLALSLTLAPCSPGQEPQYTGRGYICTPCPFNTFNTNGEECQTCPRGAQCAGGDQIASQENWWRASSISDEFYSCRTPEICMAGPAAGDEACMEGYQGPLCAVCEEATFAFAGKCHVCDGSVQAKLMLGLGVAMVVSFTALIFLRDWEFGKPNEPGMLTKFKILISHFQLLALLRDYDVLWPPATATGLAWFDLFNVGLGITAPECFLGERYTFWLRWVVQMALPVAAVALCVAVYYLVELILQFLPKEGPERPITASEIYVDAEDNYGGLNTAYTTEKTSGSDGPLPMSLWPRYLNDVKVRCWKNAFWLVTLLYPRCSMTALQMFSTQTLDIGTYLTADFSIRLKGPGGSSRYIEKYVHYMVPGAIMLVVFAVVIPTFWFLVIWRNRHNLEDPVVARKYGFLYGSYSREFPTWETFEALRKFSFAFIPVFIPPNSVGSVQGTVGQLLACGVLVATVWLRPFATASDNNLQIASQIVIFVVLMSGCAAKWASLSKPELKGLAVVQLVLSSAVAFACISLIVLGVAGMPSLRKRSALREAEDRADAGEGVLSAEPGIATIASLKARRRSSAAIKVRFHAGSPPVVEEVSLRQLHMHG